MAEKEMILNMRALAIAANSIRFNPEIDPHEAELTEARILKIKENMGKTKINQISIKSEG